jgi:hypothetical protein
MCHGLNNGLCSLFRISRLEDTTSNKNTADLNGIADFCNVLY